MTAQPETEPFRLDPDGADDRHTLNARLRAHGGAAPVALPGGLTGYAVTRHADLKDFLAHPDVAKDACHFAALAEGRIPEGWPLLTFATVPGMTTADGADHRRLRGLATKAFTPRRVEELRPRVAELTTSLLDGLAEAAATDADGYGTGVADLRRHFALPLPMGVLCGLMGIDAEHTDRLHTLSNRIVNTNTTPESAVAANREMVAILAQLAAIRAAAPGDDLISALITAREEDGSRLSEQELIGTMLLLIVAGHETTLNLITNAVRALCAHRDQLALLQAGKVGWEAAVEETMRWDAPVSFFPFRYPTRDLEVGGTLIPKGAPVLAGYTAAGRDETAHGPDAHVFDVTRDQSARHLSFGHGAHYCIGAPLARLEATTALRALFTRHPDLDLAIPEPELPAHPSFVGNSRQVLPVRLTPVGQ
ncbi:cytochrome P450 [Streptomyces sp. A7024]|uniref:Cytochrome P450 n=1 Tax=Streptomyces coryli TaxID=1128680 RepID=A0A6G4UAN3_9ACTN|nr:cytochrome P450 [Streptomyces coryli]NGN69062.1 cytochrome P450 [Streptomyces coryli]